jgi:hypothetical protein
MRVALSLLRSTTIWDNSGRAVPPAGAALIVKAMFAAARSVVQTQRSVAAIFLIPMKCSSRV